MEEAVLLSWKKLLLEEISELQRQLEPLAAELKRKREKVAAVERLLALEGIAPAGALAENGQASLRRQRLADMAFETLRAAGRPMHYRELCAAVAAAGFNVPGKDPATNLIAHIGPDPRFLRVKRGTYSLVEWKPAEDVVVVRGTFAGEGHAFSG
ncbi:MAG: winged helix-turn-helix domain-containing protein [Chloroflexi bacterium]|nr:winged helix-turn-helix domain-containing protein [Chloroflexota bacterium]